MFTGIIHHQGLFKVYRPAKKELNVEVPPSFPTLEIGESVAVDGVCLSLLRREAGTLFFHLSQATLALTSLGALHGVSPTVAEVRPTSFDVELIPLTVAKSNLKDLKPGRAVNLECDIIGKYVYNWVSRGRNRS